MTAYNSREVSPFRSRLAVRCPLVTDCMSTPVTFPPPAMLGPLPVPQSRPTGARFVSPAFFLLNVNPFFAEFPSSFSPLLERPSIFLLFKKIYQASTSSQGMSNPPPLHHKLFLRRLPILTLPLCLYFLSCRSLRNDPSLRGF